MARARLRSILLCAALTAGLAPAHADPEHGAAGAADKAIRRARTVAAPSLRGRNQVPGIERELPTPESELIEELRKLESERPLRRGTTAIYVVDAVTGRQLYAVHEDEPLNPASNVKLISTATALDVLGPDWRYTTRLLGPAPDADGAVAGHLYLIGSYDPTLQHAHLAELAAAIKAAGVTRVHGDIVVGPEPLRDSLGWARIDIRVHGTEDGNAPEVLIDADGGLLSETGRAGFLAHGFELDVQARSTRRSRRGRVEVGVTLVDGPAPRYRITVTGTIAKERRVRVRRQLPVPQIFTAQLLRAALVEAGIEVLGAVRQSELDEYVAAAATAGSLPIELARHESVPMASLVARINKRSLNALADRVVMTAGAVLYGGAPTMDKGVRAMQSWLREHAGLDPERLVIDTGSGLSRNTAITARQIVRVLRAASGLWTPTPDAPDATAVGLDELLPTALVSASEPLGRSPAAGSGAALVGMLADTIDMVELGAAPAPAPALARAAGADQDGASAPDDQDGADEPGEPSESGEPSEPGEPAAADRASGQAAGAPTAVEPAGLTPALAFLSSLAVGGVDGTLRYRFRELRGEILAKTGTLRKVVALSGLVSHGDQKLAFAIVTNGTDWRQRQRVRRQHEHIVAALHRYLRKRAGGADAAIAAE
jgi:D-alanyl-D-alanine carboxypeptidase/D-alanyl-D-alanine-endopeptidase (penicillin-binding protein 4)